MTRFSDAKLFLETIYEKTPKTAYTTLSFLERDKNTAFWKNRVYQLLDLDKIAHDATTAESQVFVRIPVMAERPIQGRGTERDTLGSSVLWIDIDCKEKITECIERLESFGNQPNVIIKSGNGIHAYWLLEKMSTDLEALKSKNKGLQLKYNRTSDSADHCFDLARVMRMPGTYNLKGSFPKEVEIVRLNTDKRYTLGDFESAMLDDNVTIESWEEEDLGDSFLQDIKAKDAKLYQRITTEESALKANAVTVQGDQRVDRSRNDQWIANRLMGMGYTPGQAISVLSHGQWFSGSKYRETQRADYVIMTVNKAALRRNNSPDRYFDKRTFIPPILARELLEKYHYMFSASTVWVYHNGVYSREGENHVRKQVQDALDLRWSDASASSVVTYISDQTLIDHTNIEKVKGFVNVTNGMLNLETLDLHEHNPRFRSLNQLPVMYDVRQSTEFIDQYLESMIPEDCIPFFWEYVGSIFVRDAYFPKALLCIIGQGDSGKSKLVEWIRTFLGHGNCASISLQALANNRFASYALFGKLANLFADLDESEAQGVGQIKALTGDDTIGAEKKFGDYFDFKNNARLIFSANHYPAVKSPDKPYFDRVHIIPCDNVWINSDKLDPWILEKLTTEENLSATLLRAIEGYQRLMTQRGFTPSLTMNLKKTEYKSTFDTITAFMEMCTIEDPNGMIFIETLYQQYAHFCKLGNKTPYSDQKFYRRINDEEQTWKMVKQYKVIPRLGKQKNVYIGRRLEVDNTVYAIPYISDEEINAN